MNYKKNSSLVAERIQRAGNSSVKRECLLRSADVSLHAITSDNLATMFVDVGAEECRGNRYTADILTRTGRRFSGNRNVALKSAHTLQKLIMEARVTCLRKGALHAEGRNVRLVKLDRRSRNRAKWNRLSSCTPLLPLSPIFMVELPLFRYSRFSVGLTEEPPTERRQRMDFLLSLNYYAK